MYSPLASTTLDFCSHTHRTHTDQQQRNQFNLVQIYHIVYWRDSVLTSRLGNLEIYKVSIGWPITTHPCLLSPFCTASLWNDFQLNQGTGACTLASMATTVNRFLSEARTWFSERSEWDIFSAFCFFSIDVIYSRGNWGWGRASTGLQIRDWTKSSERGNVLSPFPDIISLDRVRGHDMDMEVDFHDHCHE